MSKLLELFNQKATSGLNANRGLGSLGWWPPAEPGQDSRTVDVVIEDLLIETDNVVFSWKGGSKKNPQNGGEVPAVGVQFVYRLLEDPDNDGEPRKFNGRRMLVVPDSSKLPEDDTHGKQQTRARIAEERLLGFAESLLGETPDNFGVALESLKELVDKHKEGTEALVARLRLDYNDGKPDQEYCQENLS